MPTVFGLIVFGVGQGALMKLVFNVLVTAVPKNFAGDVGSLRGTTQNLASAVGTAVMGAVLVTVLSAGITTSVNEHPELPAELVAQVPLDNVNFTSNDDLTAVLEQTTATDQQIQAAVALNEKQRLRTLRMGFLILAGISAAAALPASRLPRYRPGEIPDPQAEQSLNDCRLRQSITASLKGTHHEFHPRHLGLLLVNPDDLRVHRLPDDPVLRHRRPDARPRTQRLAQGTLGAVHVRGSIYHCWSI